MEHPLSSNRSEQHSFSSPSSSPPSPSASFLPSTATSSSSIATTTTTKTNHHHNTIRKHAPDQIITSPNTPTRPLLTLSPTSITSSLPFSSNNKNNSSTNFSPSTKTGTARRQSIENEHLKLFGEECRKMFYTGDPIAIKSVEQIMRNLPAGSKAAYTKQMSIVRSQFHRDSASSRRAEVDRLLIETVPSSTILKAVGNDTSLSAMRSPRAREERMIRLKRFIDSHCVRNMVGVHPFFGSLCAVLHLMSLPARKGGSGKRRVEWDIDLTLFSESGGEPFLRDSIQFLKGVLGFEDHLKALAAPSLRSMYVGRDTTDEDEDEDGKLDVVIGHPDGDDGLTLEERQEIELDLEEDEQMMMMERAQEEEGPFGDSSSTYIDDGPTSPMVTPGRGTVTAKGKTAVKSRDRSASDPFLDPSPTSEQQPIRAPIPTRPIARQISPRITVSHADEDEETEGNDSNAREGSNSSTPKGSLDPQLSTGINTQQHRRSPTQNSLDAPPPAEIRIFRSASYLTSPELKEMVDAFPNFISVRSRSIKFDEFGQVDGRSGGINHNGIEKRGGSSKHKKVGSNSKDDDGKNGRSSGGGGYVGHGVIRISVFEKDLGWKGSFLERIKMFIYRFLGV